MTESTHICFNCNQVSNSNQMFCDTCRIEFALEEQTKTIKNLAIAQRFNFDQDLINEYYDDILREKNYQTNLRNEARIKEVNLTNTYGAKGTPERERYEIELAEAQEKWREECLAVWDKEKQTIINTKWFIFFIYLIITALLFGTDHGVWGTLFGLIGGYFTWAIISTDNI